jgi:hypothetical protein
MARIGDDMAETTATWNLALTTTCPGCREYVDLLDYADFWNGRQLEACEHATQRSHDVEVTCPECMHEFAVDLEY